MNATPSNHAVLDDGTHAWTAAALESAIAEFAGVLRAEGVRVLATLLDNSVAWVAADRAAERVGAVHVPLPVFFAKEQIAHALKASGADALLLSGAMPWPLTRAQACCVAGESLALARLPNPPVPMPEGTTKITFTSGTTGTPKGVCLRASAIDGVSNGVVQALAPLRIRRHLCVLPFAVLLENIAGLNASLLNGSTCIVVPLSQLGLAGSSGFDPAAFHSAVLRLRPDSVILLPQMLRLWAGYLAATQQRAPDGLTFVAVGGAPVGAGLLAASRALGIPAHEGYGLSEGASVQTLNLPGADLPGSAGRVLPHARVRISEAGEIEVSGSLLAGYLGELQPVPEWFATGDLGTIDANGFLHVQGRRKNVLITSFGRNVSPEWVEGALQEAGVGAAVVFGDGEPTLSAVLWPMSAALPDAALQAAVDAANNTLPDYARVHTWVRATQAFNATSGMATANGRPQRTAIFQAHVESLTTSAH
ncbi:AMP-binding protein [uncultured Hydrogenophaga sp.]|uniref:AMP-binding protein n=1 Tax=uncultured Hydrogenophaga sp. TaxID=199683 RepID=UPI00265F8DCD|nr:AMP-binding protein [uncultured Hydrogenophaga sp.]